MSDTPTGELIAGGIITVIVSDGTADSAGNPIGDPSSYTTYVDETQLVYGSLVLDAEGISDEAGSDLGSLTDSELYAEYPEAPVIVTHPESQAICYEDNIQFVVVTTGADLTYQWQRNGVDISDDEQHSGCTADTLDITAATTGATYRCVVTNDGGSVTSNSATLTINTTTAITAHPTSVNICAGASTSFSVTAVGTALTYQWQKGGVNLSNGGHYSGVTTTTLTVSTVDSGDLAAYRCVVAGTCGSETSSAATITLKTTTAIVTQPVASSVCSGSNTSFSVAAVGESLTYRWQKNGVNITDGGRYWGSTTNTLYIIITNATDVADYRCVVTGTCGSSVNSDSVGLTLKTATAITTQPQPQDVVELGTAVFSVTATGESLTYQWQRNNINISDGVKYSGCTTSELTIVNAAYSDVANYRCVVTGTCGFVASTAAALTIGEVTTITQQPTSKIVNEGKTTIFYVVATGDNLTYQWQKDGEDLSDGGHYSGSTTSTLTVSDIGIDDVGTYICTITGDYGIAVSDAVTLDIVTQAVEMATMMWIEPAVIQTTYQQYVKTTEIANSARLTSKLGCELIEPGSSTVPYPDGSFVGDVIFREGYNCVITSNITTNTIMIGAKLNAGAGPACDEDTINGQIPITEDEISSSVIIGDGPLCNEVITSINGVLPNDNGNVDIRGTAGITVLPIPDEHKVRITLNCDALNIGCS